MRCCNSTTTALLENVLYSTDTRDDGWERRSCDRTGRWIDQVIVEGVIDDGKSRNEERQCITFVSRYNRITRGLVLRRKHNEVIEDVLSRCAYKAD